MNKTCVALTDSIYEESVRLLRSGFKLDDGTYVRPNPRIATVAVLQATLGLRLGDVLGLRLGSFIRDGNRYRLDIVEEKTRKPRTFTVPTEVYSFVQDYSIRNGLGYGVRLFDVSERQVERHLAKVFRKMGLPAGSYGSHSYRKYFATRIYVDNGYNIELVRVLLQHSSVSVTQRYLGMSQKAVEDALSRHVCLV